MTTADERCGTYAGIQVHRKRSEPGCEPCMDAQRRYMREYRRTHPGQVRKGSAGDAARNRAFRQLARRHPAEFADLYRAELAKATS